MAMMRPALASLRALDHRQADAAQAEHRHLSPACTLAVFLHRADAGGHAAARAGRPARVGLGLILASETSATTVYSLKVEQPM
jgi:hypothetical protein